MKVVTEIMQKDCTDGIADRQTRQKPSSSCDYLYEESVTKHHVMIFPNNPRLEDNNKDIISQTRSATSRRPYRTKPPNFLGSGG